MPEQFLTRRADELANLEPVDVQPRPNLAPFLVGVLGVLVAVEFVVGLVVIA